MSNLQIVLEKNREKSLNAANFKDSSTTRRAHITNQYKSPKRAGSCFIKMYELFSENSTLHWWAEVCAPHGSHGF